MLPSPGRHEATLVDTSRRRIALSSATCCCSRKSWARPPALPADADPSHRHVVRLTECDPRTGSTEQPQGDRDRLGPGGCAAVSAVSVDADLRRGRNSLVPNVSVARGNIVLADHGLTQPAETLPDVVDSAGPYRPQLQYTGLTLP